MRESAVGLAVEFYYILHSEGAKQLGDHYSADRIDCVDGHCQIGLPYSLYIDEREIHHHPDVAFVICLVAVFMPEIIYLGKGEVLGFCYRYDLFPFGIVKKFAMGVQKFQGVPLCRIM